MPDLGAVRGRHLFVLDLMIVAIAIVGSMILRFDSFRLERSLVLYFPAALLPLIVRPPVNVIAGMYARAWAYASIGELVRITTTVVAGTAIIIVTFYLALVPLGVPGTVTVVGQFPRSFFVLEGMLTLLGYGGIRFMIRAGAEWPQMARARETRSGRGPMPTLIYGAGATGVAVARTIAQSADGLGMHVVGYLDDDSRKRNQVVRGATVLGPIDELSKIAAQTGARRLLIAIPSAPGEVVRGAVLRATDDGLETRSVPALEDLVSGRLTAAAIREVRVEDLLRREPVQVDDAGIRQLIEDRVVLVTGAGGSIGSELARQVFELDPKVLVLLDRAEGPLYEIERELILLADRDSGTATRNGRPRPEIATRLASVTIRDAMERVLQGDRPSIVLHAAAYKHVPMMESHPAEAIYANVGGTLVTLRASLEADVERFVLVSTDKAVEPSSVMGATKRLAELAVAEFAARHRRNLVAVRFGNVLGSSGSVVPLLKNQLAEGVPLTLTHPDATRYFMTIPEASRLILQASVIGQPGDLFVLDMGEPVKILDLARDLARLAGRDPDSVPIKWIGLRPGEKVHEALFYGDESTTRTEHPKIWRVRQAPVAPLDLETELQGLIEIARSSGQERARAALFALIARLDAREAPTT